MFDQYQSGSESHGVGHAGLCFIIVWKVHVSKDRRPPCCIAQACCPCCLDKVPISMHDEVRTRT
jgi:hypothetical protein